MFLLLRRKTTRKVRCVRIRSIYSYKKITDASVIEIPVAKGSSQLTSINLYCCDKITDRSVIELAKGWSQLTSINLRYCNNITDASVSQIKKDVHN
jgi:hypothetical protein